MYRLFHASSHLVLLAFLITIYLLLLACHAGSPFLLLLESQTLLPFRRLLYVCSLKRLCCLVALLTSHLRDIFCLQYQEWVCLREIHNTAGTHMNLHCPEVKDIAANGSSQCLLKKNKVFWIALRLFEKGYMNTLLLNLSFPTWLGDLMVGTC